LGCLFFYALNNITETAWTVLLRRVYEAILGYVPIGAVTVVVVLLAG
jgi:tryptophan-rich sensory protein